ncbi:MAG: permease [Candidatus Dormibacteraeota bacterium]|nr:permease [Candidatus Dormibacteraeota bacterium]
MNFVIDAVIRALQASFNMFWEVFWPLALGFLISAIVQALVPKERVARALGETSLKDAGVATVLGAISSSCSYAAVAVARALFRKGAHFANAIIFEFASTNLVFELGLVLLILLGWRFLAGEIVGGLLMVLILWIAFRLTLRPRLVEEARRQAERGLHGKMEGHGAMDMSVKEGPFLRRAFSPQAFTAVAHYFWMDIASIWTDLLIGFLIAGALEAWVPGTVWRSLFLSDQPALANIWGPIIGPLVAMFTFVCSVGNIPLAAVLWNGGISFGGVIAFIFGDLIILPILNIYRKYYGRRMMVYLFVVSYLAMVLAGLLVELGFQVTGQVPQFFTVEAFRSQPSLDYTFYINLAFLVLAVVLGVRFLRTGGPEMLKMMDISPQEMAAMHGGGDHAGHDHGGHNGHDREPASHDGKEG